MRNIWAILVYGVSLLLLASCGEEPAAEPTSEPQVALEVDLPIPALERFDPASTSSTFFDVEEPRPTFDPLLVRNIDVVDPQRREYIESLRASPVAPPEGLELDGVIETIQYLPVFDAEGRPLLDETGRPIFERRVVLEYTFKDHRRAYRAGEKVERTNWVIPEDWRPADRAGPRVKTRNPYEPPGYMPPYERRRKND